MTRQIAPLRRPTKASAYTPSMPIALDQARRALAASERVDIGDHAALIRQAIALDERLRQLLAALAADGGSQS
ncbi:hypothetical protein AB0I84_05980 [Streptomyces spectabilis]|uniref:hypothetical protein n=1 Tax=Streptomyces spectabilis TaxID=68270 RepID=UPI003409325B